MTHSYLKWLTCMWLDSFICDMTHSYVTWLIYMWHGSIMWHDWFMCAMTHSYLTWLIHHMWHDSFICDMTHSYVTWLNQIWHVSFTRDMTHSYVTYNHFTTVIKITTHLARGTRVCVSMTWFLSCSSSCIRDMTQSHVTCPIHTWHDSFIREI